MKHTPARARGAPVVRAVIRATFEELAAVGYGALTIEDVAKRAGVNKTTVYRRWPTKEELVTTALLALPEEYFAMPNTGTIRGDLNEIAGRMVRIFQAVEGRAMMRILFFEGRLTELSRAQAHFDQKREATGMPAILNRAIARGELPVGFDQDLVFDVLFGTISCKVLIDQKGPSKAFVANLVDVVLAGMVPSSPSRLARPSKPTKATQSAKSPKSVNSATRSATSGPSRPQAHTRGRPANSKAIRRRATDR